MTSISTSTTQSCNKERVGLLRCCIRRFKARSVCDWPVVLILTCNVLIWTALGNPFETITKTDIVAGVTSVPVYKFKTYENWIFYFLPIFLWIFSSFSCAWLVGWKYKIQDVVFAGMILTGTGMIMNTIVRTVQVGRSEKPTETWVVACTHAMSIVTVIGSGPIITNLLQLTLEQIPEASTAQISALVSWFVCTSGLGLLLNDVIRVTYKHCLDLSKIQYDKFKPFENLVYTVILGIAVVIFALLKNKLIDNSPTSYSFRTLYGVIKYAIQNKHPKQRSALTYWEEELPGRLNLGKRKYGGPFTNEEVEDVRTLIHISGLCLTTFLYLSSLYFMGFSFYYVAHNHKNSSTGHKPSTCEEYLQYQLVGNNMLWYIIAVLVYELLLVPLLYYRMPNMIRRVGVAAVLAYLLALAAGIVIITHHYIADFNPRASSLQIGLAVLVGGLKAIFYISAMEFICAQSPYTMRNFFICLGISISWCSQLLAGLAFLPWKIKCTHTNCTLFCAITGIILTNVAILIFGISAKLYRKRTRGQEDEHQQRWVEEAYDKYVSNRSMSITGSFTHWFLEARPN